MFMIMIHSLFGAEFTMQQGTGWRLASDWGFSYWRLATSAGGGRWWRPALASSPVASDRTALKAATG